MATSAELSVDSIDNQSTTSLRPTFDRGLPPSMIGLRTLWVSRADLWIVRMMMGYTGRIGLLLVGSGVCALAYQIAWLRQLRLVFGGSTAASATVLAIFMLGLGVGGLVLGRRSERSANPLAFYARLEIGISIAAAASVFLIIGVRSLYVWLGGTATMGLTIGTGLRLVLATVVLGLPTFLMGGTLPAMVRAATTRNDPGRHTVGLLYAANTVGAVAGAWITTFYLIEWFGIRQTVWLAAAVNLLIAMAARSISRQRGLAEPLTSGESREELPAGEVVPPTLVRMILVAAAGVGFVFFLLELVWYRMMAPILGGSTYTFGVVLSVALAGIGLGGFLYSLVSRDRRPRPLDFAATCSLEALAVALPFALGDRIAFLALELRDLSAAGMSTLAFGWVLVTAVVVMPAAVVAGYQFPLLIGLLGQGRQRVAVEVGQTYAWNTFGAILGSVVGGFVLLPWLTAPFAWKLSIWLLCLLAGVFLVYEVRTRSANPAVIAAITLVAFGLTLSVGPTAFWRHSGIGAGRTMRTTESPNELLNVRNFYNRILAWELEGRESSVGLIQHDGYAFVVNGKADGHVRGDAPTQVMSGLIGTALHPAPTNALVVGLGTGSSAGWMGRVEGIEKVEVVELEPAVLQVAADCGPVNEDVLDNPKVEIVIADAREHLLTSKSSYDVIFSEPSNPYRAGISSLFTREFYQAVSNRLTEDGIFLQWLQAYDVDAQVIRTAYATLASVFPHVETWQVQATDLLLVASARPIDHSADRLRQTLAGEPYERALKYSWGVEGITGFYSGFVANSDFARSVASLEFSPVNTDDRPVIEFGFARSMVMKSGFDIGMLRELARTRDQHRPTMTPSTPSTEMGQSFWEDVDDALQARAISLSELPKSRPGDDPQRQARVRARQAYASGRVAEVFGLWSLQREPPRHPIDLIALTESAAINDSELLPALSRELAQSHPIEAAFAEVEWLLGRDEKRQAVAKWLAAVEAYRDDPWPFMSATERGLELARELVEDGETATAEILRALEQPFTVRLHEGLRTRLWFDLAMLTSDSAGCAKALAASEPNVPWTEAFLRKRARCYEMANHPLAGAASADLETFGADRALPIWHGLESR